MVMAARRLDSSAEDPRDLIPYTFRIQRGLLAALDARIDKMKAADPYDLIDRSKLIRDLIVRGLEELDRADADAAAAAKAASKVGKR